MFRLFKLTACVEQAVLEIMILMQAHYEPREHFDVSSVFYAEEVDAEPSTGEQDRKRTRYAKMAKAWAT